ncbi:hypothetical protein F5Y14DRAFT_335584 [Nemania sp. NC0429]|nr:hypothetical protein F5Y14DRAFT_335584 [Nemania sp. NC0429]
MTSAGLASRIAYNSVYGLLWLILAALLLVVPGDFIAQTLNHNYQLINLIVLAIVYVITFLFVLFVYVLRLYVTRTVLASIPKLWIPIEKGDVNNEVRNLIAKGLSESAAIAWEARPRVIAPPDTLPVPLDSAAATENTDNAQHKDSHGPPRLRSRQAVTADNVPRVSYSSRPFRPVWGDVEHNGWGSPASPDLANIQYATVLAELPNLIEAKAVALAPPDPDSTPAAPQLDADAVLLLQRVPNMTMRNYIAHLTELGVLPASQDLVRFLDLYERARFSGRPMSNLTFRNLMHLFAELLRAMQPLDSSMLYDPRDDGSSHFGFDGHIDDDAPKGSGPTTRTPSPSIRSDYSFDQSSMRSHQPGPRLVARKTSARTRHHYRTAPTTPRSKTGGTFASRSLSSASNAASLAPSRRSYAASQSSSVSLGSTSQGSVIRLATAQDTGDLPYVLRLTDTL